MSNCIETFSASGLPLTPAPGATFWRWTFDGDEMVCSTETADYFPVSTPRFPDHFGGDIGRLAKFCLRTTSRPLTIAMTASYHVTDDSGTPWDFGLPGVIFDGGLGSELIPGAVTMTFDENAQILLDGIAAILNINISSDANARGGFVSSSGSKTGMVIEGTPDRRVTIACAGTANLWNSTGGTDVRIAFRYADVQNGTTQVFGSMDANPTFYMDEGTIFEDKVVAPGIHANYVLEDVNVTLPRQDSTMSISSNTVNTVTSPAVNYVVQPTDLSLFVDSSTCNNMFTPTYPYDGEVFTVVDYVPNFQNVNFVLAQGSSALIQDRTNASSFATSQTFNRRGTVVTYQFTVADGNWHVIDYRDA